MRYSEQILHNCYWPQSFKVAEFQIKRNQIQAIITKILNITGRNVCKSLPVFSRNFRFNTSCPAWNSKVQSTVKTFKRLKINSFHGPWSTNIFAFKLQFYHHKEKKRAIQLVNEEAIFRDWEHLDFSMTSFRRLKLRFLWEKIPSLPFSASSPIAL